uniref:C2H2-type domain-containing protein n=1 Tax=Leptobrachium leishanense TaxID=445787 RepID=A0A8C5PXX1_9ANUR
MDDEDWKMAPPHKFKNRVECKTLHGSQINYLYTEKLKSKTHLLPNKNHGAVHNCILKPQDGRGKPYSNKSTEVGHYPSIMEKKNVSKQYIQQNHLETKAPTPIHCKRDIIYLNKNKFLTNETGFHDLNHHQESTHFTGIPLRNVNKSTMAQINKTTPQTFVSETQNHDRVPLGYTVDGAHSKVYDTPICSKDILSVNNAFACKGTCIDPTQKPIVNNSTKVPREKIFRNTSHSKGIVNLGINKPEENSVHQTFLLIDSQGLPYTMVIEKSKVTKNSQLSEETKSNAKYNVASRYVARRKGYTCPVCFRIFEYLSYLQRHSIAHSQQKPYLCKICGKSFKRTSHLTRHKYTHFGGKPFQCQVCQHTFRDNSGLKSHQQIHKG